MIHLIDANTASAILQKHRPPNMMMIEDMFSPDDEVKVNEFISQNS